MLWTSMAPHPLAFSDRPFVMSEISDAHSHASVAAEIWLSNTWARFSRLVLWLADTSCELKREGRCGLVLADLDTWGAVFSRLLGTFIGHSSAGIRGVLLYHITIGLLCIWAQNTCYVLFSLCDWKLLIILSLNYAWWDQFQVSFIRWIFGGVE